MTPILAFDIETVPDVTGIRKLWNLSAELSDHGVAELAMQRRRQSSGSDFLPHYLHRVVAIACGLMSSDSVRIWSLGTESDDEAALIKRFFDGIDKYTPQLVSWNGGGFDLPALHHRALIHGLSAPRYWDMGEDDRDFKWNNYISRYHTRHIDLMDLMAMYSGRANAPLDDMAKLCGFPGKLGMDGSQVWPAYQAGKLAEIRAYCETDVANTLLMFLRFQKLRGQLVEKAYDHEAARVKAYVSEQKAAHWMEFLAAWA